MDDMTHAQARAIRTIVNRDEWDYATDDQAPWSLWRTTDPDEPTGTYNLWQDLASNYTYTIYPNGETRIDS